MSASFRNTAHSLEVSHRCRPPLNCFSAFTFTHHRGQFAQVASDQAKSVSHTPQSRNSPLSESSSASNLVSIDTVSLALHEFLLELRDCGSTTVTKGDLGNLGGSCNQTPKASSSADLYETAVTPPAFELTVTFSHRSTTDRHGHHDPLSDPHVA